MNLFELFVKIGVDDQASSKLETITGKIGNGLKTAAKIGTAAVTAASTAVVALTKNAVENYAQYEQLVGGVDTLFKDASQKLQGYAAEAYKTSGMSANEYMENATSFSASLISSLGGDTEKAADYANRAMISMSDNANKMGTSLDSIVQTYQSLSRGNMAMLDNLKLGYGGTKAELERLIKDAASYTDIQKEMGVTVDASSMSFDNIVNAIAVVQGKLGIAGATAQEAGSTIEGSINSMKAAWQNLLTGIADPKADFGKLIDNFVTTIVGDGSDKNKGVVGNLLPVIEEALYGIDALIARMFPIIMEKIPTIISEYLPRIFETAMMIVQTLVDSLSDSDNLNAISSTAVSIIMTLATGLLSMLPEIIYAGIDLITALATELTKPENLTMILDAALTLITELAWGLLANIDQLIDSVFTIIDNVVLFLTDGDNLSKLIMAALSLVIAIGTGLVKHTPQLLVSVGKVISGIVNNFRNYDWASLGRNLVDGFKRGISNSWKNLKTWFRSLFGDLIGIAKRILGIASPSKVFKKLGGFTAEGFGIGWADEFANVNKELENSLAFDNLDPNIGINASVKSVKSSMSGNSTSGGLLGGTVFSGLTININGAKYTDERELVEAIAERLQIMTERREAVYA